MRVRKNSGWSDRRVPYNNPSDALHLSIIQVFMYRVQLWQIRMKSRKRRPYEGENGPKSVIKFFAQCASDDVPDPSRR
jgi:hypothetical protein